MIQQLIWLDALRTNWRAIESRLMPASASLLRELAGIADRLRAAVSPQQFAAILDDLVDLVADTEAADYVRALIASSTIPEQAAASTTREEAVPGIPSPTALEAIAAEPSVSVSVPPGGGRIEMAEAAMSEAGRAFGDYLAEPKTFVSLRVFFATNREASPAGSIPCFGGDRAPKVVFGHVSVAVPITHKKGHLERPGWFDRGNVRDHLVIGSDLELLEITAFRDKLAQPSGGDTGSDLLVFVHGFNVSFENALLRAAQLKYDLNFRGEIILFTWPSRGSLFSYTADLSSAEFSGTLLAGFLAEIVVGPWRRVHLLAHSMGGRVSLGGLVDSSAPDQGLGQIVLVAADVSTDFFAQQFPKLAAKGEGRTSYVASKDRALWLSGKFVNLTGRVGYLEKEPFVIDRMETVDASAVDRGLLAHSYFSDIRPVLDDIGYLIGNRLPARQRPNLREKHLAAGNLYWQFPP